MEIKPWLWKSQDELACSATVQAARRKMYVHKRRRSNKVFFKHLKEAQTKHPAGHSPTLQLLDPLKREVDKERVRERLVWRGEWQEVPEPNSSNLCRVVEKSPNLHRPRGRQTRSKGIGLSKVEQTLTAPKISGGLYLLLMGLFEKKTANFERAWRKPD